MFLCGAQDAIDLPEVRAGSCCWGAVMNGPNGCYCWEPQYGDQVQAEPKPGPIATRDTMCPDCAHRFDSPENRGERGYAGDADELEELAASGQPFYCHQGIRRPVTLRHPDGVEVPAHPGAYDPPIVDRVPFKLDGTPADLCAGWMARKRWYDQQPRDAAE